jgi:electron transfer flavoprotein alpha subunit
MKSILVYAEQHAGKFTRGSLESISYAADMASGLNLEVVVITNGTVNGDGGLGNYGAHKVLTVAVNPSDARQLTRCICSVGESVGAEIFITAHDIAGKLVAPGVAARWDAAFAAGVISLPDADGNVKRSVFSGKAFAQVQLKGSKKVITLTPNTHPVKQTGHTAVVEMFNADAGSPSVTVKGVHADSKEGEIPLPEANIVVSAGRGMKGPEHWAPIEELAKLLGGATACSRPVADIGWRPHHEHVGQTGVTIRPNLYIAVGISGAIQHLAGVNGSKTIVVINKDPEAPFFKAADYGIVGDAFEVLPKIIEAAKAFRTENS